MKITILTLFPEMFNGFKENSIIKRALNKGIVTIDIINIRDYTKDRYGRVDTPPIGGGAGLIMKCQPIVDAIKSVSSNKTHKIILSPKGEKYCQNKAVQLSKLEDILIVCGHYEGIDERVNNFIDESISIGDYVLTGGEIASMAIADSLIRLLDGAITNSSLSEETFENNLLEYPQYTEPKEFEGYKVPDILYTGNHEAIEKYRRKEALKITKIYRPDMFEKHVLTKQDLKLLKEIDNKIENPKWLEQALEKGKKFTK
ncbi:MAG: tRNA (guanosine(37)-N1)-methyltransferase TrmD [Bacilli bacterium]|nr:tRNA (guanosine(37)-N1)-methyltransferase TrmD [Bacilli bacterium]